MSLRFILYFWYSNRTYLMYRRIKTTTGSKKIFGSFAQFLAPNNM